jgi:hypothetical protein
VLGQRQERKSVFRAGTYRPGPGETPELEWPDRAALRDAEHAELQPLRTVSMKNYINHMVTRLSSGNSIESCRS